MTTKETVNLEELETLYKGKIDFFTKKLEAIQVLKQPEEVDSVQAKRPSPPAVSSIKKTIKEYDVPLIYSTSLPQKDRVYFALREIGEGFMTDVRAKLNELDDTLPKNRIGKIVVGNLSILKKEGYIRHEALTARKFKYFIK